MSPVSFPVPALSCLGEFSPIANMMASAMLDFPLPLGPVITVNPLSKLMMTARGPEDLKPRISSLRM